MDSDYRDILTAAALEVANTVRSRFGKPPVDHLYTGKRYDPYACAITNTIYDDDWDRYAYRVATGGQCIRVWNGDDLKSDYYLPIEMGSPVQQFIYWFDLGRFPELEETDNG